MVSRAAWAKSLQTWTTPYMCIPVRDNIETGQACLCRSSPVCLHHAWRAWAPLIAELTTLCLCSLCLVSAVGVTQRSACLSLTAWGTTGEEVSGHLPLPLHLDHTSTFQLVSVVDQHVVQVCGHLRKDADIWHPQCETLNSAQKKQFQLHIERFNMHRGLKTSS